MSVDVLTMACSCSAACWWRGKITFWNIVVLILFGVYAICDYKYYTNTLESPPFGYCKRVSTELYQWFVILGITCYVLIIYAAFVFYAIKQVSRKAMYLSFLFVILMMAVMIFFGSFCILHVTDDYKESFYCGPMGKSGGYLLIISAVVLGICAISFSYFIANLFISYNQRQAPLLDDNDNTINDENIDTQEA